MAKWDEKDPRWLVAERQDGQNVNSWHWEEKNRLEWSKMRINDLMRGLTANLDAALGTAEVTGVSNLSGEAYLTMRKGNKKFAVYDLQISLAWVGRWFEDDAEVKGEIKISEFSLTNDPDEYVIDVTVEGTGNAQSNLKVAVSGLRMQILDRLDEYVTELNKCL